MLADARLFANIKEPRASATISGESARLMKHDQNV
jgi:hypothetical protein